MAPPQLAEEQIVAGPDWPDAQSLDGEWRSLRTPVGEYDLALLLAKIPSDQQPDVIVSFVDGDWRNVPRNLSAFAGEKILLAIDSKQAVLPLGEMFRYIGQERFERVVFLQDQDQLSRCFAGLAAEFHHLPRLVRAS